MLPEDGLGTSRAWFARCLVMVQVQPGYGCGSSTTRLYATRCLRHVYTQCSEPSRPSIMAGYEYWLMGESSSVRRCVHVLPSGLVAMLSGVRGLFCARQSAEVVVYQHVCAVAQGHGVGARLVVGHVGQSYAAASRPCRR